MRGPLHFSVAASSHGDRRPRLMMHLANWLDSGVCNRRHPHAFLCLALALAAVVPVRAAPPGAEEKAAVTGRPTSLVVQPKTIRLSGPRSAQQIIVTGRYPDGSERDLTPFCALTAEDPGVVGVAPGGFVQARKAGRTTLIVQAAPPT